MKRSPARPTVAGLALSGLLLASCGGGSGGDDAAGSSGELLATVDTMFGPVEIPEPEDGELTVVTLGWSDAEAALALGVKPVAVHDWMSYGEENKAVGPWATELFEDETPAVIPRNDQEIDYELVQSFEPDLILNTNAAGGDEAEFERLSSIAPTVYGPEGSEGFTPGWRAQTQQVATALGKPDEADALIGDVEDQIETAAAEHPEFAELSAVTASKFGEAYGVNLPGDFRWDILGDLGFTLYEPVAELAEDADSFYADISPEMISDLDADVAVLYPIGFTLEDLESDPLIEGLSVVQDDRAVLLEPEGEISQAFSVASVLSIPIAVEQLTPLLADAAANAS